MEFYKNTIKIDDGTEQKRQTIKGNDGEDLKFISLIGAINYMSLQGWELVDTKSVTHGFGVSGSSTTNTNVYYIFNKDVSDEELQDTVSNSYKK